MRDDSGCRMRDALKQVVRQHDKGTCMSNMYTGITEFLLKLDILSTGIEDHPFWRQADDVIVI